MNGLEDGDRCPNFGECCGRLFLAAPIDCSCHINAPCPSCLDVLLTCDDCGYEVSARKAS